jgi:chromosome segregation ATPase
LLRKLFNIKLSTAVEEVNQMQDATAKLKTSTETLEQNLK